VVSDVVQEPTKPKRTKRADPDTRVENPPFRKRRACKLPGRDFDDDAAPGVAYWAIHIVRLVPLDERVDGKDARLVRHGDSELHEHFITCGTRGVRRAHHDGCLERDAQRLSTTVDHRREAPAL
jgi:hypothetical protein